MRIHNLEEKKKIKRVLYSKTTLILVLLLFILAVRGTWNLYQKSQEAKNNRLIVESQIKDLKTREAFLHNELNNLSTDYGIESEVRQKFNVKKDGEQVAVIIPSTPIIEIRPQNSVTSFFNNIWNNLADIFR